MSKGRRTRPFSNGTEFMDWYSNNCEECKYVTPIGTKFPAEKQAKCLMDYHINLALIDDGTIPTYLAYAAGYDGLWMGNCPKVPFKYARFKIEDINPNQLKMF